jgi:tetratricopeptide (TPR) repeat protein
MTPSISRVSPRFSTLLFGWVIALLVSLAFFKVLSRIAPVVLKRDRDTSVWYLKSLADEDWRQFNDLGPAGDTAKRKKLLAHAGNCLEKASGIRPDNSYYLWYWGLTQYQLAQLDEPPNGSKVAESVCKIQRVWALSGEKSERPGRFLATYYLRHSQAELAKPLFERLLALDPNRPEPYDGLVEIAVVRNDLPEAIRLLESKARRIHPTPEERETLAVYSFRLGDYEKAAGTMRDLVEGGAASKDRWLLFGVASVGARNLADAARAFSTYLSALDPGERWPDSRAFGLTGIPSEFFPRLAYTLLEAKAKLELDHE